METLTPALRCRDLHVYVDDKHIVKGVDLDIYPGQRHAIMGPNGSGKSTLAAALMGHPTYRVEGEIELDGQPVHNLPTDERARRGLFLAFQYPVAVPGLSVANFLRAALEARRGEKVAIRAFRKEMRETFKGLALPQAFLGRYLNDGFSGGEKKRIEIAQMLALKPSFALLDEIDSGLDIDALKLVAAGIDQAARAGSAILLVTHYRRILDHLAPDKVHVFMDGRIVKSGGPELAGTLEDRGYDWLQATSETLAASAEA